MVEKKNRVQWKLQPIELYNGQFEFVDAECVCFFSCFWLFVVAYEMSYCFSGIFLFFGFFSFFGFFFLFEFRCLFFLFRWPNSFLAQIATNWNCQLTKFFIISVESWIEISSFDCLLFHLHLFHFKLAPISISTQ